MSTTNKPGDINTAYYIHARIRAQADFVIHGGMLVVLRHQSLFTIYMVVFNYKDSIMQNSVIKMNNIY